MEIVRLINVFFFALTDELQQVLQSYMKCGNIHHDDDDDESILLENAIKCIYLLGCNNPKSIFAIAKLFNKSNLSMINCHYKYAAATENVAGKMVWFGLSCLKSC